MNTPKTAATTGAFLRRERLHLIAGMAVALIAAILGWLYYDSPASACSTKLMICSSGNLLLFISVILLVDGLHNQDGGTGQVSRAKSTSPG